MNKLRTNDSLRPSLPRPRWRRSPWRLPAPRQLRAELPGHATAARDGPADRADRHSGERTGAQRARRIHRQARRHALGHFAHVPAQPVALARALGHEHQRRSRNPHRIYPGQVLYLDKTGGRARLTHAPRRRRMADGTIKLSPRTRYESLSGMALPTLNPSLIEPFLSEPIVVDEDTLQTGAAHRGRQRQPRAAGARRPRLCARRRQLAAARDGRPDQAPSASSATRRR